MNTKLSASQLAEFKAQPSYNYDIIVRDEIKRSKTFKNSKGSDVQSKYALVEFINKESVQTIKGVVTRIPHLRIPFKMAISDYGTAISRALFADLEGDIADKQYDTFNPHKDSAQNEVFDKKMKIALHCKFITVMVDPFYMVDSDKKQLRKQDGSLADPINKVVMLFSGDCTDDALQACFEQTLKVERVLENLVSNTDDTTVIGSKVAEVPADTTNLADETLEDDAKTDTTTV